MSHHKWGIWWMALLAWNASNFGGDLWRGRYWWTLASGLAVIWCAAMAYLNLTKPRLTVTIHAINGQRVIDFGDTVIRSESPKP